MGTGHENWFLIISPARPSSLKWHPDILPTSLLNILYIVGCLSSFLLFHYMYIVSSSFDNYFFSEIFPKSITVVGLVHTDSPFALSPTPAPQKAETSSLRRLNQGRPMMGRTCEVVVSFHRHIFGWIHCPHHSPHIPAAGLCADSAEHGSCSSTGLPCTIPAR